MPQIQYPNDQSGSIQIVHGSDGRFNTSSRSDARAYYNSRDEGQTYALTFDDIDAAVNDFSVYWQNTSPDKILVVSSVGVNSTVTGTVKLHFVTGVADTASALTLVNLNRSSSNAAAANCLGNSAVGTIVTAGEIDQVIVGANAHEELRLGDRVRLGQNDAIAIEWDRGASNTILEGVIFYVL